MAQAPGLRTFQPTSGGGSPQRHPAIRWPPVAACPALAPASPHPPARKAEQRPPCPRQRSHHIEPTAKPVAGGQNSFAVARHLVLVECHRAATGKHPTAHIARVSIHGDTRQSEDVAEERGVGIHRGRAAHIPEQPGTCAGVDQGYRSVRRRHQGAGQLEHPGCVGSPGDRCPSPLT